MDDKSGLLSAAIRADDGRMNPPQPRTSMSTAAEHAASATKSKTEVICIVLMKRHVLNLSGQLAFILMPAEAAAAGEGGRRRRRRRRKEAEEAERGVEV